MQAFLKTFFALFGKTGLKALINALASSAMFQDLVHGLIMKRLEGIKETRPELYTTVNGYVTAVSKIPAVFTDENPNDVEQLAQLLRLQENLQEVDRALKLLTEQTSRAVKPKA